MAAWGLPELLLRRIDHGIRGLQWQNSGGKGKKPEPEPLPEGKKPKTIVVPDSVRRLRELGLVPVQDAINPPPVDSAGVVTIVE